MAILSIGSVIVAKMIKTLTFNIVIRLSIYVTNYQFYTVSPASRTVGCVFSFCTFLRLNGLAELSRDLLFWSMGFNFTFAGMLLDYLLQLFGNCIFHALCTRLVVYIWSCIYMLKAKGNENWISLDSYFELGRTVRPEPLQTMLLHRLPQGSSFMGSILERPNIKVLFSVSIFFFFKSE